MLSVAQLEILSSPGVVRRAAKALEKTAVNWTAKENEVWHFDFEAQQGKILPARIEHSLCNCPATGLCKHIIAAALAYLEQQQAQPQRFMPPLLDPAKLFDAAGKAACRQVYKLRQSGAWPHAEIHIAAQHVEVRWAQQKAVI
ncbi:MAG: SWIM zinc finger family protein, partial [Gammaproteobacteria bacterium]